MVPFAGTQGEPPYPIVRFYGENRQPKLNAPFTYRFQKANVFWEILELAFDGVHVAPCVETQLERAK